MSTGVPSFSSFPPTFSSFPGLDDEPGPSSRKEDGKKKSRTHSDEETRRDKDKKKHSSRDRDEEREQKRHRADKQSKDKKHRAREPKLSEAELFIQDTLKGFFDDEKKQSKPVDGKHLFIEDRKGDPGNLRYGRQSSSAVPKYRRLGYGEVLGFPAGWKLVYGGTAEVVLRGRKQSSRYTSSKFAAQLKTGPTRRLVVPPHPLVTDVTEDFIALPASRSKSERAQPITSFEHQERDGGEDSDGSSSSLSMSEDEDAIDDQYTVPASSTSTRLAKLTAEVKARPQSIASWLDLVEQSISSSPTPEAKADVALSILQKALSAHRANQSHPVLLAKYLRNGSLLWPPEKLADEWERGLDDIGRSGRGLDETVDLWMDWVEWRLKVQGVEGLEDASGRIHAVVRWEEERYSRSQELPKLSLEAAKLRFLWRMCVGIAEAGYFERAVAIFQAQIELALFSPSTMRDMQYWSKIEALEAFWNSEAPRAGEAGAKGWCNTDTGSVLPSPPSNDTTDVPSRDSDHDPFTTWGSKEQSRSRTRILPRRISEVTDDDDVDDPYSTILFSDIEPFLWDFSSPSSEPVWEYDDIRTLLVLAFVQFLGLHVPGLSSHLSSLSTSSSHTQNNPNSPWSDTQFQSPSLSSQLFTSGKRERGWEVISGVVVAKEAGSSDGARGLVKEWGLGATVWSREGGIWNEVDLKVGEERVGIVRDLLQLVCTKVDSPILDQYWVTFEAASNVKQALKVSKSILSTHRESLQRWITHARLERMRNRPADARKVYEACLLSRSIPIAGDTRPGAAGMWWDWVEMEWLGGDNNALRRLIGLCCGESGSAGLLRSKRALEELVQNLVDDGKDEAVPVLNLLSVLDLVLGAKVDDVLERYNLAIEGTTSRHNIQESLAVTSTLLLYHYTHTLRASIPPSIFRAHCTALVRRFPSNTLLLGMWLDSERGERVWGRVNVMMKEIGNENVMRVLWAVGKERDGGEVERARGVLGRAVAGERSRASVTLWMVAVQLELALGDTKRAKALVYRAVAECPWAKELYLLSFTDNKLRAEFTRAEMVQWTNTMLERSIRVRVDGVEELLEEPKGTIEDGSESDEEEGKGGGDRELEMLVEERRRLMPY